MQAPLCAARGYARLMGVVVPEELKELAAAATARTLAQAPVRALAEARGLWPGRLHYAVKAFARLTQHCLKP